MKRVLSCSKISISGIVKHVQYNGIIKVFCLPREIFFHFKFTIAWGDKKIAELRFARGSVPRISLCVIIEDRTTY